jgi:hypothetical protein
MEIVVHLAGPVGPDRIQRCVNCGSVLTDSRIRGIDFPSDAAGPLGPVHRPYPEGAFIERGPSWQALTLRATATTCGRETGAPAEGVN